jgi:hypothetical protein
VCIAGKIQEDGSTGHTDDSMCTGTYDLPCEAGARIVNGTCVDCPRGRYGQEVNGTSNFCTDCGLGKFAAQEKSTKCTNCEPNMVTGINFTA